MRKYQRMAAAGVAAMMAFGGMSVAALGASSEGVLDQALEAVSIGQSHASEMALAAAGQDNRARGLARAAEALAAAAEQKLARGGQNNSGRGIGRGHADEVRAVLLGEGSPSDLAGHGESVRILAQAFETARGSERAAEVRKNSTDDR